MSLDDVLTQFTLYEPAGEAAIEAVQARFGVRFPADYVEFLRRSNGAISNNEQGGFVVLHPVEDIGASEGRLGIGYDGGSYYFDIDVGRDPPAADAERAPKTVSPVAHQPSLTVRAAAEPQPARLPPRNRPFLVWRPCSR